MKIIITFFALVSLCILFPKWGIAEEDIDPYGTTYKGGEYLERFQKYNQSEKLDARICNILEKKMMDGDVQSFVAILNYMKPVQVEVNDKKNKKIVENKEVNPFNEIFFQSVAIPDPIYLLLLIKSELIDMNAVDESGRSVGIYVFHGLSSDGRVIADRLRLLVEQGYKPRVAELLVGAAMENSFDVLVAVEGLQGKQKFDVNVKHVGTTPLIQAVRMGAAEMVGGLLARGANPNLKDDLGKNAIDYSATKLPEQNNPRYSLDEIIERQDKIRKLLAESKN